MQDCEIVPLQGTRNDQNMQWNTASETQRTTQTGGTPRGIQWGKLLTQRENKVKTLVTFKSLKIFCGKAFKQCQNLTELKAGAQKLQSGTIKHSSPQKPLATYSVLSLENGWILTVSLRHIYIERERVGPCIKNAWYICNHFAGN